MMNLFLAAYGVGVFLLGLCLVYRMGKHGWRNICLVIILPLLLLAGSQAAALNFIGAGGAYLFFMYFYLPAAAPVSMIASAVAVSVLEPVRGEWKSLGIFYAIIPVAYLMIFYVLNLVLV